MWADDSSSSDEDEDVALSQAMSRVRTGSEQIGDAAPAKAPAGGDGGGGDRGREWGRGGRH